MGPTGQPTHTHTHTHTLRHGTALVLHWYCTGTALGGGNNNNNKGDMDLILEILAVMDRKGLQPDLGLLDLQLFTGFPRSS